MERNGTDRPEGPAETVWPPRGAGTIVAVTAEVFDVPTRSVDDTRSLAAALAPLVREGDLILLGGDLGAGKTAFTQGLAAALGVRGQVQSPTFTIERIHHGRVRLHHLDVYRLATVHELLDLGLHENLEDGAVVVVEWGDAIAGVLDQDHLAVRIHHGDGDDDRMIRLEPVGPTWASRSEALGEAVRAWQATGVDR